MSQNLIRLHNIRRRLFRAIVEGKAVHDTLALLDELNDTTDRIINEREK